MPASQTLAKQISRLIKSKNISFAVFPFSCILTQGRKINELYANFVVEELKTNKEMGKHIGKAVAQCMQIPRF